MNSINRHSHPHTAKPRTGSSVSFWLLIIGLIGLALYSHSTLRATEALYSESQAIANSSDKSIAKKVEISGSDKTVYLSSPFLVRPGNLWGLTSRDHPLPEGYAPSELIDTTVAHGDAGQPMKVQKHIEIPLKALFAAAESDGIELMLSSAYRSIPDQQKLYSSFVAKQGAEMAKLYVASPGTSEHHTGAAVDLSSASEACENDSDKCSLSQAAAQWLLENSAQFGFIQRYPEGKQPITGVAFEPWHYRYVGVALAEAMESSPLTLDEVIEQMAPGLKLQDKD